MNIRHTPPITILTLILLLLVACLPATADPVATPPVATITGTAAVPTPTLMPPTTTSSPATSVSEAPASPTATASPTPSPTAPTPTATGEAQPTPAAAYIMALVDMDVRGDPRPDGAIVGHLAHGQIARVAGVTADEAWWLLDCPVAAPGVTDHCWVRAGEPHTMPQPDATRIETGDAAAVTVEGTLDEMQRHYVFHAAGADITITIASPGNSVLFHLQGLGDGVIYKHMLDGETGWTGRIAQNQDVLLALNGSSGDAYTLTVSREP